MPIPRWLREIKFDANGLIPAIVQEARSDEILMVAYMNREAILKTVKTGRAHFYSRSRKRIWLKGETSGHIQRVNRIRLDCDGDALLIAVRQTGGACHEGYRSCFYRTLHIPRGRWRVTARQVFDPQRVYNKAPGA
jgi:phosphoribosyl-AMP cyclohydrolase